MFGNENFWPSGRLDPFIDRYAFTKPAPDGTLEFSFHVEGHYVAGMRFPITVK